MSAILEGFEPMAPAANDRSKVRIEHVCTSGSTVEPLPYLVDAQRRSDRRAGRNTWVLMGSSNDEALLIRQLRSILGSRAQEEGDNDSDGGRWGVRCTLDMKDLSHKDDCVLVTTLEYALNHLMEAKGATPRLFSDKMTFILYQGWGNLTLKAAYACNKLVKFAFDNKTASHFFCTISSLENGPFNQDWVRSLQCCRVVMGDETSRSITCYEDSYEPLLAMDELLAGLQRSKTCLVMILMEYSEALKLKIFRGEQKELEEHCHVLSSFDNPEMTWKKLSDTSKHILTNAKEVTYLGDIPGVTHVIIYPLRQGSVWDHESNQVVVDPGRLMRPRAELEYAMCWRSSGKAPEVHYLVPREVYENLEEDRMDSMVYTSLFDNHVLSSLSDWPQFSVEDLPLKCGRNPHLIEERLRRLTYKGLLELDEARDPKPRQWGLSRYCTLLKPTLLGRVVSELVKPYVTAVESAHAACLLGQLVLKMTSASAAMKDAVCSLAVVLTTMSSFTYIDSIIKPKETFKEYMDNPRSLASELCPRGPIWFAVCVWHFTLTNNMWKRATDPLFRGMTKMGEHTEANGSTLVLWYDDTFKWEYIGAKTKQFFDGCGVDVTFAGVEHKLSAEELLEVEVMLVTAFLDKLAFVFVPTRDGAFGYSMTTRTELSRPTDEQLRLINLNKCWEEDKAVVGRETPGIYCVFTHCRRYYKDDAPRTMPYDLTYVSTVAVRRALDRVKGPVIAGDVFGKIETDYKLEH